MSCFQENELVSGGVRLWWGMSLPGARVRAEVVLTHGLGEHGARYEHVAECLAARQIRLIVYDLRGHGRSGGRRGDAPGYTALIEDLQRVISLCPRGEGPIFLMGHSLGGQITLQYLLQHADSVAGAIIASPWLRLAFAPARWRVVLARLMLRWWPSFPQKTPTGPMRLSRDLAHLATLPLPNLIHHRITARLFFAIDQAGRELLEAAPRLQMPLLLMHGEADEVTSPEATRDFFQRVGTREKRLILFPDALHETHNDLCRDQVLGEITNWLMERLHGDEPC
jgi:alpha-beta hydrolase superfamily lysophospholipase